MRFVLAQEVLNDDGAFRDLIGIVNKVADEWHLLDAELDALETSGLYQRVPECDQEALRAFVAFAAAYAGAAGEPHALSFLVSTASPDVEATGALAPREARRLAATPLTVVVENGFTDRDFFRRVFEVLRADLRAFEERGALVFHTGGGIDQSRKKAVALVNEAKAATLPARVLLVIDSDRLYADDTASRGAESSIDAEAQALAAGVPVVRLRKRMCENYLPNPVLRAWGEHVKKRTAVEALLAFTAEQRDHFPFQNGFDGVQKNAADVSHQSLFANVDGAARHALKQGIGKLTPDSEGPTSVLHPGWWKGVVPDDLRERCGDELETVVAQIAGRL